MTGKPKNLPLSFPHTLASNSPLSPLYPKRGNKKRLFVVTFCKMKPKYCIFGQNFYLLSQCKFVLNLKENMDMKKLLSILKEDLKN